MLYILQVPSRFDLPRTSMDNIPRVLIVWFLLVRLSSSSFQIVMRPDRVRTLRPSPRPRIGKERDTDEDH